MIAGIIHFAIGSEPDGLGRIWLRRWRINTGSETAEDIQRGEIGRPQIGYLRPLLLHLLPELPLTDHFIPWQHRRRRLLMLQSALWFLERNRGQKNGFAMLQGRYLP